MPLLHPATVHFPIAFLIAASVAGLAYIHWRRLDQLRIITWWSMTAGWFVLILTIVTGIVDQGRLPPDAPYRTILNWHTTLGLALAVVYGNLLYRGWLHNRRRGRRRSDETKRRGSTSKSDDQDEQVEFLLVPRRRWLLTAELLLGIVLVIAGAWLGGQLVYTWGVNVAAP
jgi:uncharacterized membrane protein